MSASVAEPVSVNGVRIGMVFAAGAVTVGLWLVVHRPSPSPPPPGDDREAAAVLLAGGPVDVLGDLGLGAFREVGVAVGLQVVRPQMPAYAMTDEPDPARPTHPQRGCRSTGTALKVWLPLNW